MIIWFCMLMFTVIYSLVFGNIVQKDVPIEGKLTLVVFIIGLCTLLTTERFKESITLEYLVSKELGIEMKNDETVDKWIQNRIKRTKVEIELKAAEEKIQEKYDTNKQ